MRAPVKLLGSYSQILPSNWKLYMENVKDTYHASLLHMFFTTFRLNRLSQKGGLVVSESGGNHISYSMAADTGGKEYEQAGMRAAQEGFGLEAPEVLEAVDEFGDGIGLQILSVFPSFVLQQTRNSLAVRRIVPLGLEKTELVWTCFGFADDDAEMTERRLRQANLIGPAGYISMEDGAAPGFVQRGVNAARRRIVGGGNGRAAASRRTKHVSPKRRCAASGPPTARIWDCNLARRTHESIEVQLQVQELLARYVQAIDDDRLEAWPDFFTEQCRYLVTTAENVEQGLPLGMIYATSRAMLRDRVRSLREANVYEAQRYRHVHRPAAGRAGGGRGRAGADELHCRPHHAYRRDDDLCQRPLRRPDRPRRDRRAHALLKKSSSSTAARSTPCWRSRSNSWRCSRSGFAAIAGCVRVLPFPRGPDRAYRWLR